MKYNFQIRDKLPAVVGLVGLCFALFLSVAQRSRTAECICAGVTNPQTGNLRVKLSRGKPGKSGRDVSGVSSATR